MIGGIKMTLIEMAVIKIVCRREFTPYQLKENFPICVGLGFSKMIIVVIDIHFGLQQFAEAVKIVSTGLFTGGVKNNRVINGLIALEFYNLDQGRGHNGGRLWIKGTHFSFNRLATLDAHR